MQQSYMKAVRFSNGDFIFEVVYLEGSPNSYDGIARAQLSALAPGRAEFELIDVKVNAAGQMLSGSFRSLSGFAPRPIEANYQQYLNSLNDGNSDQDSTATTNPTDTTTVPVDTTITVDDDVVDVFSDEDGNIIVVNDEGDSTVVGMVGTPVTVTDEDGEEFYVDENGQVTDGGSGGATADGSGGSGGSGTSGNTGSESDDSITLGPLTLQLAVNSDSSGVDSNGLCFYENLTASVDLSMEGGSGLSKDFSIDNTTISYKKDCNSGDIKEITVQWSDESGYSIGKLGLIDVAITALDLTVNENGELSGNISADASLSQDATFRDVFIVQSGVSGSFSFSFSNTNSFNGQFDFAGIENLNVLVKKDDEVLASLNDAQLSSIGEITGTLRKGNAAVSYTTANQATLALNSFEANIRANLSGGFEVLDGSAEFQASNIKGITGSITVGVNMLNNNYASTIRAESFSAFGMDFENLNLNLITDQNFDIQEISGSLEARHPDFNTELDISSFIIRNYELVSFAAAAEISYQGNTLIIQNAQYDGANDILVLDAVAQVNSAGTNAVLQVEDFTIDQAGNISIGDFSGSVTSSANLGPLAVAFTARIGKVNKRSNTPSGYKHYESTASFFLRIRSDDGVEKEVAISEASISMDKVKNQAIYRNVVITWDGDLSTGDIYGFEAAVRSLNLTLDNPNGIRSSNNFEANLSGTVGLEAGLNSDVTITPLITLKSGLDGDFNFNFSGSNSFSGSFDLNGIEGINLALKKGQTEIARLENGSVNSQGLLTGQISGLEGATYSTNGFEVAVGAINLDIEASFQNLTESFRILNGSGDFTIRNIQGVEGELAVGMNYRNNEYQFELDGSNLNLSVATMTISDPQLTFDFNSNFDLTKVQGSLKASHSQFDAAVDINQFEIENGALTKFSGQGNVNYRGFALRIANSTYSQTAGLSVTGDVHIDAAGTSAWLAVEDFTIGNDGTITIREIEGDLSRPPLNVNFTAGLQQSRFRGRFSTSLANFGLDGAIDIGRQNDFSFAYLELATQTDLVLGSTGLKLTEIGGQGGFNYRLQYVPSEQRFTGDPLRGNYVLGLKLGVADVANFVEVTGNPIVQFGNSKLDLTLNGTLKIPRNQPVLESTVNVNYVLPDNTIDANLNTRIQIPRNSGYIFDANAGFNFSLADNQWSVSSTAINGSLLREINFMGNFNLSGTLSSPSSISGTISGRASLNYRRDYSFEVFGATLSAGFGANFNSMLNFSISDSNLSGQASVGVHTSGSLGIEHRLISASITIQGDCTGTISYINGQGNIRGTLMQEIDFTVWSHTVDVDIDRDF